MYQIALTGNRKSGKKGVSKLFTQIGVPVYDADAVIKHLLQRDDVRKVVNGAIGKTGTNLNVNDWCQDDKFSLLLDLLEFEVWEGFKRFKEKHKGKGYCIYKSSFIFERKLMSRFDFTINVFTPKEERIRRMVMTTGRTTNECYLLLENEMSDFQKNELSDYVIHNYQDYSVNILEQVNEIDADIVETYLDKVSLCSEKSIKSYKLL